MSISNIEINQIQAITGLGQTPLIGGPAGLLLPFIAQTIPIITTNQSVQPNTGVMFLNPIHLAAKQVITNINFISATTAESSGTHLWFALYDDGRGTTAANQLALLGQTADQTGSAAFAANTNLGLSLLIPYTTTYSGLHYVAVMCAATTTPGIRSCSLGVSLPITIGNSANLLSASAGSGLTAFAPSPSGALSSVPNNSIYYAYVS